MTQVPDFDPAFRVQLDALFRWRRDVRHFRNIPVSPARIDALLKVAALAPSVGLSQPWRFVTVDDQSRRAAIRANFNACNADALGSLSGERARLYAQLKLAGLDEAPCHIALYADQNSGQGGGLGRRTMPETIAYSAVMALHTLWLAACADGLGLGWVSILDPAAVTAILDVPADWRFIGYFCLGYPDMQHDTPELERAGWESRQAHETCRR